MFALQASVGGKLRMVITGAAPTSPTVLSFLRAALGCQVRRPAHRHMLIKTNKNNLLYAQICIFVYSKYMHF